MVTDSWKDRLTSYNNNPITYDNGGNPLTYNNGSSYTFTWEGRRMQTAKKGNAATWSYTFQSRYYDPVVGRFLNADDVTFIGTGNTANTWNFYVYCDNNSINAVDPSGHYIQYTRFK